MPEDPEFVECDCKQGDRPLWGFCDDDLHCPLCGRQIAWLRSAHQYPEDVPDAPIWIYPEEKEGFAVKQYVFPLVLHYADTSRRRRQRAPEVDFQQSIGPAPFGFQPRLEPLLPKHAPQRRRRVLSCRLVRSDEASSGTQPRGELELHPEGVDATVDLVGDFRRQQFRLKICNTPKLAVDLEGHGVEKAGDNRWDVVANEDLELEFTLRSLHAPVLVAADLTAVEIAQADVGSGLPTRPEVSVQLRRPLTKGTRISPGHPWRSPLRLDARNFREPGHKCELLLRPVTAITEVPTLILKLERVEKGQLEFWPNPLEVPVMYLGEVRSNAPSENHQGLQAPEDPPIIRKLFVTNRGSENVRLRPPLVALADNTDAHPWVQVRWATDTDPESVRPPENGEFEELELRPGERGEIYVKVNLKGFPESLLSANRSFQATISTVDQRNTLRSAQFCIHAVQPRQLFEKPVAIDLGNTHSYVAVWNPGAPFPRGEKIVAVHDLKDPEQFPTALFFRDLSVADRPDYLIGREAAQRGRLCPHALVTDLKRWIGDPSGAGARTVDDEAAGYVPRQFPLESLACLYLQALIERAEAVLRKYTITQIGVSYPSRFDRRRRAAIQELVGRFCQQWRPGMLAPAALQVDEANAVAIGFVFEQDTLRNELPRVVSPERPEFVVASFDLGGGSLDTAVLRFSVEEGNLSYPIFHSEYLGIGGDELFGGDNVTVAFMELLKARLRKTLAESAGSQGALRWLDDVPEPPRIYSVPKERYLSYLAFWTAAEEVKIYQSRAARGEDDVQRIIAVLEEQLLGRLPLGDSPQVRQAVQNAIRQGELLIELAAAYDHKIQWDMVGERDYSVRQRIETCVDELCEFAGRKRAAIDFVVLGGAGSRLPLVEELLRAKLPQGRIIHVPHRTKSRVAFGLVRYLDAQQGSRHTFARSSDYTTSDVCLRLPGSGELLPVVPSCSRVDDPQTWYPLLNRGQPLPAWALLGGVLTFFLNDRVHQETPLGWFELRLPASPQETPSGPTPSLGNDAIAEVRLLGSEEDMELRIVSGGQCYGSWRMQPGQPPGTLSG